MRNFNSNRGFTLIEAVVAASVFAFVVSSVVGIYLAVASIDTKTRSERGVQQNARFIMDFLGKEIRNGSVNYSAYPGSSVNYQPGGYTNDAHIINQAGESETITCDGTNLVLTKASGATNLNSPNVTVTRCAFYVNPATSPFESLASSPPNQQPFITVVLQLTSTYTTRDQDRASINLQSTFAVREYPSRD